MEAGAKGRFIPASLNKDGSLGRYSSALSQQELHTVLEYSKLLIAAMGRELLEGRVEPEPALTGRDSCRYCLTAGVRTGAGRPKREAGQDHPSGGPGPNGGGVAEGRKSPC